MARDPKPLTVAAVDLGSNSFHMVIGRYLDRELQVVDRMRENVMLAAGLDDDGTLTEEAQRRALACLEKMGQRLRSVPSVRVRAVGTNTLRRARNAADFRLAAQTALGHPIEIISGQEESRLILLGVATDRFGTGTRLLTDIGGGSTEVIIGEGVQVVRSHSLHMGCVTYTRNFFPDGQLRKESFRKAEIAARLELRTIEREIRGMGWEHAIGSSGTILAIQEILRLGGWSDNTVTLAGLKRLRRALLDAGSIDRLSMPGLKGRRGHVLPGGLSILRAVFKSLEIEEMTGVHGALREGVLQDLIGRIRHDDVRDHTIRRMGDRYHVDLGQATRVERTARRLLSQVSASDLFRTEDVDRWLVWASQLHEIGLAVSHTGFHKHGAYLIEHGDMPGFSADEQTALATIVRWHRRKLLPALFDPLSADRFGDVARLSVLFRLAVLLNRSRIPQVTPVVEISKDRKRYELCFPADWSTMHPLTRADLEREVAYLRAVGIELVVSEEAGNVTGTPDNSTTASERRS